MALADIKADMLEYSDYDLVGSVARARLYVVACRQWLQEVAESASNNSSSMTMGKASVESLMRQAQEYIVANATTSSGASSRVRFLSAEGFR